MTLTWVIRLCFSLLKARVDGAHCLHGALTQAEDWLLWGELRVSNQSDDCPLQCSVLVEPRNESDLTSQCICLSLMKSSDSLYRMWEGDRALRWGDQLGQLWGVGIAQEYERRGNLKGSWILPRCFIPPSWRKCSSTFLTSQTQTLKPHLYSHVCLHAYLLQSCLILCNPMECSLPGSYVCRILQARILEWVAVPSSRGSSWPRNRTCVSYVSYIDRQDFYH